MNWRSGAWGPLLVVFLVSCSGSGQAPSDVADGAGDVRPTDGGDATGAVDGGLDGGPELVAPDLALRDLDTMDALCPDNCDDGNECTVDQCEDTGCSHQGIPDCCPAKIFYSQSFDGQEKPDEFATKSLVPGYPDKPELPAMVWHQVQDKAHSPPGALYFGDPASGDYDNGHRVAAQALLQGLELPSDDSLMATFWLYLDVEAGPYSDYVTVSVLVGEEQVRLWAKDEDTPVKSWFQVALDLTPFAGRTVALVFQVDSHDEHENGGQGVFVDDVTVARTCQGPLACTGDVHCDLGYACVSGNCLAGFCQWDWATQCCLTPGDCEDWDGCTIEKCAAHECLWQDDPDPLCCTENSQCDDGDDLCTSDVCMNSYCTFLPSAEDGCCQADEDCNDFDPCTIDLCTKLSCHHINTCCTVDADCDDGDDLCTVDSCIGEQCLFTPSGAEGCCAPTLVDEGFETGWAEFWSFSSTDDALLSWEVNSLTAYAGEMALNCAGDAVDGPVVARALLPLAKMPPAGASLTFRLNMTLEDPGECEANAFSVRFGDKALGTWCNSLATWQKIVVPLDAAAGQSGELALEFAADPWAVWEGAAYQVSVDEVLLTQPCCSFADECDDDNVCTADSCPGLNSFCQFEPVSGCCVADSDCLDDDPCTLSSCLPDHTCQHINQCCDDVGDCDDGDNVCTEDSCLDGFCQFLPTGQAGCCSPEVYSQGFESGVGGWEIESDDSGYGWHITDGDAHGGVHSLYYGNLLGTNYGSNNEGRALSPPIDIPTGATATVSGFVRYDTEECCDKLAVALLDEAGIRHPLGEVSGISSGWEAYSADISEFVGQTVRLELAFAADGSLDGLGVFVDDLALTIDCCSADEDCDDGSVCTTDSCPAVDSLCVFSPIAGCCTAKADCDDGDECTTDTCSDGQCQHVEFCCVTDQECDDGDATCTQDLCVGGLCTYLSTGADGCCAADLYVDSFENGLDGYQIAGESDDVVWHTTAEDAFSGPLSLAFTNQAADTYGPNAYGTILTPEFTLPLIDASPRLVFMARYQTEACCDWWKVHLVVDGEWIELGKYGGEEGWKPYEFPLGAYLGKTVQAAFEFDSDSSLSHQGVFIDDLAIEQLCCSVDADCDDFDPCTADSCPGEASVCNHLPVANCCVSHDACDDGDACTNDVCSENQCVHFAICCQDDSDCDDLDDLCSSDSCINGKCKYEPQYTAGCCFPHLFLEDFDEPLSNKWAVTNTSAEFGWHLSNTKSVTGGQSLYYGNASGDDYGTANQGEFTTPPIDIPAAPSATLAYQLWLDTEAEYDELKVSVLWNELEIPLESLSGSDVDNWQLKEVDLTDFVGQLVQFRFRFESDNSKSLMGVWIDQLRVEIGCCDDDNDCLTGSSCVTATCAGPNGMCLAQSVPDCCQSASDCDDEDPCTANQCLNGSCVTTPICCENDVECDDGDDLCTLDECSDGVCHHVPLAVSGCCQTGLFFDSFESGQLEGWTVANDQDVYGWQVTVLDASDGLFALIFSDAFGQSYGNNSTGSIRSPDVSIPAGAVDPVLRFQAHYESESCCDEWTVALVVDGADLELDTFAGEALAWAPYQYDLSAYKGKTVSVRFSFASDSSSTDPGVFIDEVRFEQACCSQDADCDDGNPCTTDSCPGPQSQCVLQPVAGCCLGALDCSDDDPCTLDGCTPQHTCSHTNICCAQNSDCNDGDDVCTTDMCVDGVCQFVATGAQGCCTVPLFRDDFSSDLGWQYGPEWERGPAAASDCALAGGDDPALDVTQSADNAVAGVVLGGCTTENLHETYYLTSPAIDAGAAQALQLGYWRWLNSDYSPYMTNVVEVFDGLSWQVIWESGPLPGIEDEAWGFHSHDISAHANSKLQVRFGYRVEDDGVWSASSWNIDDVVVTTDDSGLCCLYDSDCAGFDAQCSLGACQ